MLRISPERPARVGKHHRHARPESDLQLACLTVGLQIRDSWHNRTEGEPQQHKGQNERYPRADVGVNNRPYQREGGETRQDGEQGEMMVETSCSLWGTYARDVCYKSVNGGEHGSHLFSQEIRLPPAHDNFPEFPNQPDIRTSQ